MTQDEILDPEVGNQTELLFEDDFTREEVTKVINISIQFYDSIKIEIKKQEMLLKKIHGVMSEQYMF
jgi:hypothetical protein